VLSASGLVNVVLNLFFVLVVGLSVEGVALATVIANAISTLFLGMKLAKDEGACRFSFKKLCLDRQAFRDILYVGLPAGIQGSLFSLSNMVIQSSILQVNNTLYPNSPDFSPVVTGNAATANLEGFIYTAQNSVYHAALTFVGQGVGARRYDRVRSVCFSCLATVIGVGLTFGLLTYGFGEELISIFSPGNEEVIRLGMIRMRYMCLPYFICGIMEVGSGILRGLGKSTTSMIVAISGICGIRLIWLYTIFKSFHSLEILYLSYPVTWMVTACAHFAFAIYYIRKMKRDLAEDPVEHPIDAPRQDPIQ
jgi:Na+-driven multidrug efflux pump